MQQTEQNINEIEIKFLIMFTLKKYRLETFFMRLEK